MSIILVKQLPSWPKQATGLTLSSNLYAGAADRADVPINFIRAAPFWVPTTLTLDRIGIRVRGAGAGGSVARVGIYTDNENWYPASLIGEAAATIDGTSVAVQLLTVAYQLTRGVHWLAMTHDSDAMDISGPATAHFTFANESNGQFGWSVATAYGALPSTYPAGGAADAVVPLPYYRILSYP